MMDEDSSDESDDFEENQDPDIRNYFSLEVMKWIVEWVDQHPNYTIADARNWIERKRSLISTYAPHGILNSDYCSFQGEYVSRRTLSFTGERTTEVSVKRKHNITHSYTVQPISSAAGHLLKKFC
ncbi:unnamed protein product [Rotaria sp. Silwood2]|nr:unnamed protein product [Rotaria sp. Silwood2]